MTLTATALAFIGSILAGFIGSLLGLGGGIIIIPMATLLFHVPMHQAIGVSIIAVIATSSAAASAYVKDNVANLRVGSFLELATTTGALLGAVLTAHIPSQMLTILFSLLLIYSAYNMFQKRNSELPQGVEGHPVAAQLHMHNTYFDRTLGRQVPYKVDGVFKGFAVMWGAGIISGLLGIGSGMLKVLGMDMVMRLPMKVSTATSNFMIGVTAAASAGYYFASGLINPSLAGPVALGVFVGARSGSSVMSRLRSSTLRKVFVPVLLYTAVQMLVKGVQ